MKTIFAAAALTLFAGSAAFAGDFDSNEVELVLRHENLAFTVTTEGSTATEVRTDITVLPHAVYGADAYVTLGATYKLVPEALAFNAKYNIARSVGLNTGVYASLKTEYTLGENGTGASNVVTPLVGVSYRVNDKLGLFGEVSNDYVTSSDWANVGGEFKIGTNYALTDTITVSPSVTRSFNTGSDETNVNLKAVLAF